MNFLAYYTQSLNTPPISLTSLEYLLLQYINFLLCLLNLNNYFYKHFILLTNNNISLSYFTQVDTDYYQVDPINLFFFICIFLFLFIINSDLLLYYYLLLLLLLLSLSFWYIPTLIGTSVANVSILAICSKLSLLLYIDWISYLSCYYFISFYAYYFISFS